MFLLTSNYEGYGLSVLEAAIAGLLIVMTDVGIAGEVIKDEESGIVVPVGERAKLAEAILRLRREEKLRKRLSGGAKNIRLPYESFEDYREKLIASFRQCKG